MRVRVSDRFSFVRPRYIWHTTWPCLLSRLRRASCEGRCSTQNNTPLQTHTDAHTHLIVSSHALRNTGRHRTHTHIIHSLPRRRRTLGSCILSPPVCVCVCQPSITRGKRNSITCSISPCSSSSLRSRWSALGCTRKPQQTSLTHIMRPRHASVSLCVSLRLPLCLSPTCDLRSCQRKLGVEASLSFHHNFKWLTV